MKKKVFISLLGTQIFGTLNPATALLQSNYVSPDNTELILMPTKKTIPNAKKIKTTLEKLYPEVHVEICEVSLRTTGKSSAIEVLQKKLKEGNYEKIFYNIAGGLNYLTALLAANLFQSHREKLFLLYPENFGVLFIPPEAIEDCDWKRIETFSPRAFNLEEFLDLQGLEAEIIPSPELNKSSQKLYREFLKYCEEVAKTQNSFVQKFLMQHLENSGGLKVKTAENEEILFEKAFLSPGNNLYLIKIIPSSSKKGEALKEARKTLNFSMIREKAAEIFHQALLVLTNDRGAVYERLKEETRRKVTILNIYPSIKEKENAAIKKQIEKYFFGSPYKYFQLTLDKVSKEYLQKETRHLLLFMGREVEPLLKAILGHKPGIVWMFFDKQSGAVGYPGDPRSLIGRLNKIKNKIEKETGARIKFVGVDFYGSGVLEFPRPTGEVMVNVTPGTKSQAVFLALWAKKNNASIFSLDKNKIALLEGEEKYSIPEVPLEWLLAFAGEAEYQQLNESTLPEILFDPETFKNAKSLVDAISKCSQDQKEERQKKRGELWEKISAKLIAQNLSTKVYVNVKVGVYQKKNEKTKRHRTEIDLAFRYDGGFYVASCKFLADLGEHSSEEKIANEIEAMGQGISRFALPLISWSNYWEEEPRWIEIARGRKVPVVGVPILKNPEKLKKVLKELKESRQRT